MTRLVSGGCLIFLVVSPAFAAFTLQEPQNHDIWQDSAFVQPVQSLSARIRDVMEGRLASSNGQAVISPSGADSGFMGRLAGEFLGDDFLLQPVSLMRLDYSTDPDKSGLTADSSGFDLRCCYPGISRVYADQAGDEKIIISRMPAPSAVLLALAGVAMVGWLRHRLTAH
jgi:hypothetical protein